MAFIDYFDNYVEILKKGENLEDEIFEVDERFCNYCNIKGDKFDLEREENIQFSQLFKKVYWISKKEKVISCYFICRKEECREKERKKFERLAWKNGTSRYCFDVCAAPQCLKHVEKEVGAKGLKECKEHCGYWQVKHLVEKEEEATTTPAKKKNKQEEDCIIVEVRTATKRKLPWNKEEESSEHWEDSLPFFDKDRERVLKRMRKNLVGHEEEEEEKEREVEMKGNFKFVYQKNNEEEEYEFMY